MDHRKYHWLWFLLGVMIAVILATLMGCEQGKTDKGRDCIGFAGMSIDGEQCEVIIYPPPPPQYCCMALTPSCVACQEGISLPEWIVNTCGPEACNVEYAGWDEEKNEPIWLCQAIIID